MEIRLPLPVLLSHALIAFTIEFDNESERQMAHRTTRHGATPGSPHAPWLVSLAMFANCMQFVDEKGISVRELERRARTKTNLAGMQRWGYITVAPDPADPKPARSAWLVRATSAGRRAQEIWRTLFGVIEQRWRDRFGEPQIDRLRESLSAVASRLEFDLPDCLPILGYGLFSTAPDSVERNAAAGREESGSGRPVSALLSRVLLAFAIQFERQSDLSLAISANVLRVLDEKGVRVKDLPGLTGVSKEAISAAMGFLGKRGIAVIEAESAGSRTKVARLTRKGGAAQDGYRHRIAGIEEAWQARFGEETIGRLRAALEPLVGDGTSEGSPLFSGLEPHPGGWRASVGRPRTLPHFPMVLHRGGFPDGS